MGSITLRKASVYVLIAVPVLGLVGIAAIAQQNSLTAQEQGVDPVADAARKARQQKKDAPKPKKVYTDDDVKTAPPTSTTPAPATDSGATSGETKEGASADGAKKPAAKNDEQAWRSKFREARQQLADTEHELDILQREQQKAQVQYYTDPQKAMNEQYNRKDISEKDTKIAAKKQEVEQLKQKIADMEDELRRSGGEIGWARE